MEETGRVIALKEKTALISTPRKSGCQHCRLCLFDNTGQNMILEVNNPLNAQVGQMVKVEMPGKNILLGASLTYLVPLIVFIMGILFGNWLGRWLGVNPESFGIVLGFSFLAMVILVNRLIDRKISQNRRFHASISAIISEEDEASQG